MNKTFFFQIGDKPAIAYDVDIDGIVGGDAASQYHYQMMAHQHAKCIATVTGQSVMFYAKGDEHNAKKISLL